MKKEFDDNKRVISINKAKTDNTKEKIQKDKQ
jgi:hypothetical protein